LRPIVRFDILTQFSGVPHITMLQGNRIAPLIGDCRWETFF